MGDVALSQYPEVNLFLRGIVPLVGYPSCVSYYDRSERFAGESKYPLRKMIEFALDAITSFSVVPLRIITAIGFLVFLVTIVTGVWIIWVKWGAGDAVPGWASTVLPMLFLGGIQILCLGVMGEYLGKIYSETKGRPRYFVERCVNTLHAERERSDQNPYRQPQTQSWQPALTVQGQSTHSTPVMPRTNQPGVLSDVRSSVANR